MHLVAGRAVSLQAGVGIETIVVQIPMRGVAFRADRHRILSDETARIIYVFLTWILEVLLPATVARDAGNGRRRTFNCRSKSVGTTHQRLVVTIVTVQAVSIGRIVLRSRRHGD